MTRNDFYYPSADWKTKLHGVEWLPERKPEAVLQIVHGVTEHMLYYEEMAQYFTDRGFVVVGNDHIGHGRSIADGARSMYFGPEGSWFWVERDAYACQKMMKEKYPDLPYTMLGLSLGSFVVRSILIRHPQELDGAILAGTGQTAAWMLRMTRNLARLEGRRKGEDKTTPLIKSLTFGTYNRKFSPCHTDYDWICASKEGLDTYIKDDLRGEAMSCGLFREMLTGMLFTGDLKDQKKMDENTPILLLSGEDDPVGEMGKGVKRTYESMVKAGVKDVSMKLYPGLRHDIFLEDNRQDIFQDMYQWMGDRNLAIR